MRMRLFPALVLSGPRRLLPLGRLSLVTALLLAWHRPALADDPGWRLVSERRGLRVERREVPGSAMPEVRVSTHSPLPPPQVVAAVWAERPPPGPRGKSQRRILEESASERLIYERVDHPLVSAREYTARLRRSGDGVSQPFRLTFGLDYPAGPPPTPGMIRLPALRGAWTVTAAPAGGSDVVYTVFSEPGGSLPGFLVRGVLIDSARDLVVDTLAWAERHR